MISEIGRKKKNSFKFGLALSLMGVSTSMFLLSSLLSKVPPLQQLTKQLLSELTEVQTLSFFNELVEAFYSGDHLKETVDIEKYRLWCLDQICGFIRNSDIPKSEETIKHALKFIFAHTYYIYESANKSNKQKPKPKSDKAEFEWGQNSRTLVPPLSELQRSLFSQRLFKLLFDLKKTNQYQSDWEGYLWRAQSALASNSSFQYYAEITSETESALKIAQSTIEHIDNRLHRASEKETIKQLGAFKALIIHLSLSLLTNQGDSTLKDSIEELQHIYEIFFPANNKKTNNQREGVSELVDLLVSLLTRESVVLRGLVGRVFSSFMSYVDSSTLDILLGSINLSEEKNLFDTEDDEHTHEDVEGSDESESDGSDGSDESGDDADDADDAEDTDDASDEENASGDATKDDSEEEPDNSVLLDDIDEAEMMKLDSHLERHFKELKKHQKKQSGILLLHVVVVFIKVKA